MNVETIDRLHRQLAGLEACIAATDEPDSRDALIQQAARIEQHLVAWEIEAAGQ